MTSPPLKNRLMNIKPSHLSGAPLKFEGRGGVVSVGALRTAEPNCYYKYKFYFYCNCNCYYNYTKLYDCIRPYTTVYGRNVL